MNTQESINTGKLIVSLAEGQVLDSKTSEQLFNSVFSGEVSDIELSAILVAMKQRKESAAEIAGAARSMRRFASRIELEGAETFDTCGTGGDGSHSFNISSAVALILSSMGIGITKHGNRSVSSKSGSADFLEALGIPINLTGAEAGDYFSRHNFIFLFAPNYHPAMKYAMPVRKKLAMRTIFNYLGPITNPAFPRRQMIGVFSPHFLPLYAEVVSQMDYDRVLLYSARNGMDEISPLEPTLVYDVRGERITHFCIDPSRYIDPAEADSLPSHLSPEGNAGIFLETAKGKGPDVLNRLLAMNTALALYAMERGGDFDSCYREALDFITSGRVYGKVRELQEG